MCISWDYLFKRVSHHSAMKQHRWYWSLEVLRRGQRSAQLMRHKPNSAPCYPWSSLSFELYITPIEGRQRMSQQSMKRYQSLTGTHQEHSLDRFGREHFFYMYMGKTNTPQWPGYLPSVLGVSRNWKPEFPLDRHFETGGVVTKIPKSWSC